MELKDSPCGCIERIDEWLGENEPGVYLETCMVSTDVNAETLVLELRIPIALTHGDGKHKAIKSNVIANYCPFCGKAYNPKKAGKGGDE